MAGDWIKMRSDLREDPTVIGMSGELSLDEDTIVGKLHRLWSWADKHTSDGQAAGLSESWVDRYVQKRGFAASMARFGWLLLGESSITFPDYHVHMGLSAKRRADNTNRKKRSRTKRDKSATPGETDTGQKARPEKSREENPLIPLYTFGEFWAAYPARKGVKQGKAAALEEFDALDPNDVPLVKVALAAYVQAVATKDLFPKDAVRFLKKDFWRDFLPEATNGHDPEATPWVDRPYCAE